jgi:hypothetical protein
VGDFLTIAIAMGMERRETRSLALAKLGSDASARLAWETMGARNPGGPGLGQLSFFLSKVNAVRVRWPQAGAAIGVNVAHRFEA